MSGYITLDTSVLIATERGDRDAWTSLRRLISLRWVPVVPTVVVAEAWRGRRQARLAQALKQCRIVPLDEDTARHAGELCARSGLDDPVDAIVVTTAAQSGGQLWTHDPHLAVLAAHIPPGSPSVAVRRTL